MNLLVRFTFVGILVELLRNTHSLTVLKLEENYDRELAPTINDQTVNVTVHIDILNDVLIDEAQGDIIMDVDIFKWWKDYRVAPLKQGMNLYVLTDSERNTMWIPNLAIDNVKKFEVETVLREGEQLYYTTNGSELIKKTRGTIYLTCPFEFGLYPLDVQKCRWFLYPIGRDARHVRLHWLPRENLYPLNKKVPKYRLLYNISNKGQHARWGSVSLRILIYRDVWPHFLVTYFPSGLFVVTSWGSFLVSPEVVPGRMVLLVTNLLSLITMLNNIRNNSPSSTGIKPIEVWLVACIVFLASSFMEYALVLFHMRCHASWRQKKPELDLKCTRVFLVRENEYTGGKLYRRAQSANTMKRKITTALTRKFRCIRCLKRSRFKSECLDLVALILFPFGFVVFNIVYWLHFYAARKAQMNSILQEEHSSLDSFQ